MNVSLMFVFSQNFQFKTGLLLNNDTFSLLKTGSLEVSGKLPTYPSLKSTLTLTSHLGQNVGLGEG